MHTIMIIKRDGVRLYTVRAWVFLDRLPLAFFSSLRELTDGKYKKNNNENPVCIRVRVTEGLQRERGVKRSLQEEKVGYLLVQSNRREATEVLEVRDYCDTGVFDSCQNGTRTIQCLTANNDNTRYLGMYCTDKYLPISYTDRHAGEYLHRLLRALLLLDLFYALLLLAFPLVLVAIPRRDRFCSQSFLSDNQQRVCYSITPFAVSVTPPLVPSDQPAMTATSRRLLLTPSQAL